MNWKQKQEYLAGLPLPLHYPRERWIRSDNDACQEGIGVNLIGISTLKMVTWILAVPFLAATRDILTQISATIDARESSGGIARPYRHQSLCKPYTPYWQNTSWSIPERVWYHEEYVDGLLPIYYQERGNYIGKFKMRHVLTGWRAQDVRRFKQTDLRRMLEHAGYSCTEYSCISRKVNCAYL